VVGADLDVILDDDAAGLRNFLMTPPRRQKAKSVLADADAGMDNDAVADQGVKDRRMRADGAVPADANVRPDHRARANQGAASDLGARADHRERIDDHIGFEARGRIDLRARRAPDGAEQRGGAKQAAK
jgi:hypothetical protein